MRQLHLPVLLAMAAVAQQLPADTKVLTFRHTEAVPSMQEMASAIRAVAMVKELVLDDAKRTVTITAAPSTVALVEWMFTEWDRPATMPQLDAQGQDPVSHEYRVTGAPDEYVRILYLTHNQSAQELQEAATLVRAIGEIRMLFTYNGHRAIAIRGAASQVALSDWLVRQLNRPVLSQPPAPSEFRAGPAADDMVHIFYLTHNQTVQELQEAATCVRAIGEIPRLFTYNGHRAIAIRGSASQVALSDWLVRQLNRPVASEPPAPDEFRAGPAVDDLVHIFFVRKAATAKELQATATSTRTSTQVRRLFTYNAHRAIVLKGTAEQVAQAKELLKAEE